MDDAHRPLVPAKRSLGCPQTPFEVAQETVGQDAQQVATSNADSGKGRDGGEPPAKRFMPGAKFTREPPIFVHVTPAAHSDRLIDYLRTTINEVGIAEVAGRLEDVLRLHTSLPPLLLQGALADLSVLKICAQRRRDHAMQTAGLAGRQT